MSFAVRGHVARAERAAPGDDALCVSPRPDDARGDLVINPSEKNGATFDEDVRRELRARYGEPNRRLAAMLGPDFEPWPE